MEKNQIVGFSLIFIIIMAWSIMTKPTEEELRERENVNQVEESTPSSSSYSTDVQTNIDINANTSINTEQLGSFADASTGSEVFETLENDKIKITLSNKGGQIVSAEIKGHNKLSKNANGHEVKSIVTLLEDQQNKINYKLSLQDRIINTADLYAQVKSSGQSVEYTIEGGDGSKIIQSYSIKPGSYIIEHELRTLGLNNQIAQTQLEITNYLDRIEENYTFEKTVSTVYYKESEEGSDYCSCRGDDVEDLTQNSIDWFSFSNQFFNTTYIAKTRKIDGLVASVEELDDTDPNLKKTSVLANIPVANNENSFAMDIYVGPNEYEDLKAAAPQLEEIIPFGRSIFGSINRHFIRPFFNLLSGFIGSKGIVIVLIIFIIKMALYPLTYKMLHSQAKMGALKPELAKMKDKFKDDAQKQQMETMKVYREYGVNPMGGCLPMFIQMPIWYALFRFFPASITFRQESFLWASDLSSYDDIIQLPFQVPGFGAHLSLFTILWALATVVYTYYNMKHMDMTANPAMKYVQYLMPLMFFVFFNNYASGLTCYMFFSQLITISQTVLTKKFVFDDEKLLAELNKKKSEPKKKSGFQARLAEAMEQQRKIQEQKTKQAKKKK